MANYVADYTIFTGSGCPLSGIQNTAKYITAENDDEAVRIAKDNLPKILEEGVCDSVRLDKVIKRVFP